MKHKISYYNRFIAIFFICMMFYMSFVLALPKEIARWTFDNNSTNSTITAYGINATTIGTVGFNEGALNSTRGNLNLTQGKGALFMTGSNSVCARVKTTNHSLAGIFEYQWIYEFRINGGMLTFSASDSPSTNVYSNTNQSTGTWQHFCVVRYAGSNYTMYINGTYRNSSTDAIGKEYSNEIVIGANYVHAAQFGGLIDNIRVFNGSLSESEVIDVYNNIFPVEVSLSSPANNGYLINFPYRLNASIQSQNETLINSSFYVYYSNGSLQKIYNNTITGSLNTSSMMIDNLTLGSYIWNVHACDALGCAWSPINYTFTSGYAINSINYNSTSNSGSLESIGINLTYSSIYTGINVILNYNGTNYTMSALDTGMTKNYLYSITTPSVSAQTNTPFFFKIILTNSNGTSVITTSSYNQTVSPLLIDNCGSYTKVLLNMSILDEESLLPLNGTIILTANIYTSGTNTLITSYNSSFNYIYPTPARICLSNISTTYDMDYQIQFWSNSSYFKKYKTIQNMQITNSTLPQNIILYDLQQSSGYSFSVIVVGNLYSTNGNADLLVDVQKKYISQNKFISIESSETSSDGIAIAHLIPNSEIYNFVVSYAGVTLGTFNNYQVQCQNVVTSSCAITLNLAQSTAQLPDFYNYGNISQVLQLVNNTLYHTFSSTDGITHTIRSWVIKNDGYSNTTICNNTAVGTSGTIACDIPVVYQDSDFWVRTYVDGNYISSNFFSQGTNHNWYGADIIIEILMFSCLTLLLVYHPITITLGAVLGMTFSVLLLFAGQGNFGSIFGAVLFYIIGGIVVIWQISRRQL
jgi:hypothetical protein